MSSSERLFKIMITWLIEGSRGGRTRARILLLLKDSPKNPNQLARELGLNYRTIMHHLKVLEEHGLIRRLGKGYGRPYILTQEALNHWEIIEKSIREILGEKP